MFETNIPLNIPVNPPEDFAICEECGNELDWDEEELCNSCKIERAESYTGYGEVVSNCCGVYVIEETDLCSQCRKHCKKIVIN